MDLTFQVPMQDCFYNIRLNFHHQSHSQMGIVFTLALSLHSFWNHFSTLLPVVYWAPPNLGSSSFSIISVCLFILFMGGILKACLSQGSGLLFLSPGDYVLSELSTMTRPSWVALYSMAHSFIELDKAVSHVISLVSFL